MQSSYRPFQLKWGLRSLPVRFALAIAGLAVASIASVTLLSIDRQRQGFVAELEQQAEMLLNGFELTAVNSLEGGEIEVLTGPIVLPVDTVNAPLRGTVFTSDGRSIGWSEDTVVDVPAPLLDKFRLQYTTQFQWEEDRLLAGRRVAHSGKDIDLDLVVVELPTVSFKEDIERAWVSALEVGLGASAVSTLLALMLSRTIVAPLKKMVATTERIASGELSERLPERGGGLRTFPGSRVI